ncbi:cysteine-rich CWC family protein [Pseudomonas sp. KNUC1026]|uniref:cysteine-rich CWC family protein n=1 Tax=Pseudomonas sp. KNUC1026 TaxID=2893890 RepID=UPI001F1B4DF8|nr:cysteine-rich CWC family protein [Pseudomonas sp. KNUC1026]UFH50237.1 cysteine-rich CWC family protein [Pseudomonas sp. KNUC1026]
MNKPTAPAPEALCPACGARNGCAVAAGTPEPCWCFGVTINAERLLALPPELRNARCLCPRCAGVLEQLQQHAP